MFYQLPEAPPPPKLPPPKPPLKPPPPNPPEEELPPPNPPPLLPKLLKIRMSNKAPVPERLPPLPPPLFLKIMKRIMMITNGITPKSPFSFLLLFRFLVSLNSPVSTSKIPSVPLSKPL